ncbi:MAG TPA: helix-turn-helix domain-containing protein [Gemmataceae bacterium]|jgi:hypothetical protein
MHGETPAANADRCRSVRQVAAYWRTSPKRVRQLVRRGILRAFVVGRGLRIAPEAIAEAERLLAAPTAGSRRRGDDGIDADVKKLLDQP